MSGGHFTSKRLIQIQANSVLALPILKKSTTGATIAFLSKLSPWTSTTSKSPLIIGKLVDSEDPKESEITNRIVRTAILQPGGSKEVAESSSSEEEDITEEEIKTEIIDLKRKNQESEESDKTKKDQPPKKKRKSKYNFTVL